jgi:hypothetical protein
MTVAEGSKATQAIAAEPDRFAALARDLKSYADALGPIDIQDSRQA